MTAFSFIKHVSSWAKLLHEELYAHINRKCSVIGKC